MSRCIALNILLLLLVSSCFKQDSPEVRSDYRPIGRDVDRLESCSRVNFSNGFLRKRNVLDLFSCTNWDKKFPQLFDAIREVGDQRWNMLMEPIGLTFFDDKPRRDRVIRELRKLDDRGALESLGLVLTALNETNFYDAFHDLLVCAENSSHAKCEKRPAGVATKERVLSLLTILDRDSEFFFHLAKSFERVVEAIRPEINDLRTEIRSFYDTRAFTRLRIRYLDNLMESVSGGIHLETKNLLVKFFQEEIVSNEPFAYRWVNHPAHSEELFNELVRYPIRTRPQIMKDLLVLIAAIESGLSCRPYSGNNYLELSISTEMSGVLSALSMFDHGRFIFYLLEKVALLSSAEVFCDEVRRYSTIIPYSPEPDALEGTRHEISFMELMNETATFVSEPMNFDLMSFITRVSSIEPTEPSFYSLRLLTSKTSRSMIDILALIDDRSDSYFNLMFRALKRYDLQGYENLAGALSVVKNENFNNSLESLGRLWSFYTEEEKNFLFKIIDLHMKEETDILSLLEFYAEMLEEMVEASEVIRAHWYEEGQAKEGFYEAVQEFVASMSGQPVLRDFQLFFSRDHIIEIIKVVTQGVSLTEQRRSDFNYNYRTYYTSASERRDYVLDFRRSDLQTNQALRCIRDITNLESAFYYMLINLPPNCIGLSATSPMLKTFGWFNDFGRLYGEAYGADQATVLLSREGLFSPRMINSVAANLKILDGIYDGGAESLFRSARYHLFEYPRVEEIGFYDTFEGLLLGVKSLVDVEGENSQRVRNISLNKLLTIPEKRLNAFLSSATSLMENYGKRLSDEGVKVPSYSVERFRYSCADFLNQNIGYRCPNNYVEVIDGLNSILPYLSVSYDNKTTLLGNLATAAAADKGYPIPLNSPRAVPYRMTMRETLKMQYDLSDPARTINSSMVEYTPRGGRASKQKMSVLERIEVVIRDVKFRLNYLGVQYQNAVTQGSDYNEDVASRKKLMERCIKVPVVRCGKKMSDEEKRQALNALEAYDGLLDVNNGRGLDSGLRYGNYMKTLVSTVVASSAKDSQKVRLFPLGEDLLRTHTGIVLAYVTEMGAFSHIGRWVHNRFGSSSAQFESFLNSPDIAIIDRGFLYGVDKDELQRVMGQIAQSLNSEAGKEFVGDAIKWFYETENHDLDMIEKVLGRVFVIASMIGPEETILGSRARKFPQFESNNSLILFSKLNLIIKNWLNIKNSLSSPIELRAGFGEFWNLVDYLYESIHHNDKSKEDVYLVLNELVAALDDFSKMDFAENAILNETIFTGEKYIDLLLGSDNLEQVISSIRMLDHYLETMKKDNPGWHYHFAKTLHKLQTDERASFSALKDYLINTSIANHCEEDDCVSNEHYDEPFKILDLSLSSEQSGRGTHLRRTLRDLLDTNYGEFEDLLKKLMTSLSVKQKEE